MKRRQAKLASEIKDKINTSCYTEYKAFGPSLIYNNCMAVYKGSLERVYRGRHGNTKFSDRIHYQTSQSVGQALRDAADQQKTAGQTLMDLRTRIPAGLMAHSYLPCNASQVTYQRSLAKKSHRLR